MLASRGLVLVLVASACAVLAIVRRKSSSVRAPLSRVVLVVSVASRRALSIAVLWYGALLISRVRCEVGESAKVAQVLSVLGVYVHLGKENGSKGASEWLRFGCQVSLL